jgi:hypothetical protein
MAATAEMTERVRDAQALNNGRELQYPGDEWLAEPIVYSNPHAINLRFKVFQDVMPPDADPRYWRPRHFQLEGFTNGKYVAYTRIQNDAVRRVLGPRADRWMGEDLKKDRVCHHDPCRFTTRNDAAYEDHETYTDRHRPQPEFNPFR